MNNARHLSLALVALAGIATMAGCQSLPSNSALLEQARSGYRAAQEDPSVRHFAGVELQQASDAMDKADAAWSRNEDLAEVDHKAYLAKQRVAIALDATIRRRAELAVAEAGVARDPVRLTARTNEADASQRQAVDAQASRGQLEAHIKNLNAKNTDRGMVVTIGDLLFDTNRSRLKPGGLRSLDKLGAFLTGYPQRQAMIEGFTDSTGSDARNEALSGRRAEAVRTALQNRGVDGDRIATRGYGELFPVAGNDSAAGRQLNRRVEIILSGDAGSIAPR